MALFAATNGPVWAAALAGCSAQCMCQGQAMGGAGELAGPHWIGWRCWGGWVFFVPGMVLFLPLGSFFFCFWIWFSVPGFGFLVPSGFFCSLASSFPSRRLFTTASNKIGRWNQLTPFDKKMWVNDRKVSCRRAKLSSWNGHVYWFLLPFGDLDFRSHWKDPVNICAH